MKKFIVAPFDLHATMIGLIEREARHARAGLPARIIAKMNSLVDPDIIAALYKASEAGVKIELIVRGICCLRPGIEGLSSNIDVRSIVDRFLEHSRIAWFWNACKPEVFAGSADWMPRNFFRRIEVVFPIEDGILRDRLHREILETCLADNQKSWILRADGTYHRAEISKRTKPRRSQTEFMELAISTEPNSRRPRRGKSKVIQVKLAPRPRRTG